MSGQGPWSNLWRALAAAAPLIILALGSVLIVTGDRTPAVRIAQALSEAPDEGPHAEAEEQTFDRDLPFEVSTDADVRLVVAHTRAATRADQAELRRLALHSPDPLVAGNAIRGLSRLGAVSTDPALVALLHDPRSRVREEMILALGASADPAAAEHVRPFLADSDENLRALAHHALARLAAPSRP